MESRRNGPQLSSRHDDDDDESRSRSSMLVLPESSPAVLVMVSSKSVSICNRSHARRANSGKITILGVPLFDALVRGESPHPAAPNNLIRN